MGGISGIEDWARASRISVALPKCTDAGVQASTSELDPDTPASLVTSGLLGSDDRRSAQRTGSVVLCLTFVLHCNILKE